MHLYGTDDLVQQRRNAFILAYIMLMTDNSKKFICKSALVWGSLKLKRQFWIFFFFFEVFILRIIRLSNSVWV